MEKKPEAVGIIAEYNPFHKGHKYHLDEALERSGAEVCIAVISGNFTQRGEIALLNKWTRAEMAVKNGINLVVEMPAVFACSNAGYFAKAGVEILESMNADYICFGSESGNIEELSRIAREINAERQNLEDEIKVGVKEGLSYPRARSRAVRRILGENTAALIESPNNILAIEYLKYIKSSRPLAVKRVGAGYHDTSGQGGIASATAVRKLLKEGGDISHIVPEISLEILEKHKDHFADNEMLA